MKRTLLVGAILACAVARAADARVVIYGAPKDDAFLPALRELGIEHQDQPLAKLADGPLDADAALVLAEAYPKPLALSAQAREAIDAYLARGTSVYVEFAAWPEFAAAKIETAGYERIFVPDSAAARLGLAALTILEEHQSRRFVAHAPAGADALLGYGKVAGFDRAVFGPPKEWQPALLRVQRGNASLLYAATALSNARRGRCKPAQAWRSALRGVVLELLPAAQREQVAARFIGLRAWTEPRDWAAPGQACRLVVKAAKGTAVSAHCKGMGDVALRADADGRWVSEPLRLAAGEHAFDVTAAKAGRSESARVGFLVQSRAERYRDALRRNIEWFERAGMLRKGGGVNEGWRSNIHPDGSQPKAGCLRVDCVSESALAFYLYGQLAKDEKWLGIGRDMMDYTATKFQVDSKDTFYFGDWQSRGEYRHDATTYVFNDDSGAATMMCFAFHRFTAEPRYLEPALRGIKYFRRIASDETGLFGRCGHRGYKGSSLVGVPWEKLRKRRVALANPHQMSWAQAGLLYAYAATGDVRYLDLAEKGIRFIMEAYPNWHIATSRSCEHVRMLLPLALLDRYRPSAETKQWLDTVVGFIESKQQPCGAIQEWDGKSPTSNEAFGTAETSIFQTNGDPVTDQLYDTGFALMHLWYAYKVTGEPRLRTMFERLGDYLTRIQIRSGDARFDGTWLRSFDYGRWEYFGSSADVGWGPYCVETGWSCALIDLGLLFYLSDLDPAPAKVGGSPQIDKLSARLDAEFEQVKHFLDQPRPSAVTGLRAASCRGNYVDLAWSKPATGIASRYKVYCSDRANLACNAKTFVGAATGEPFLIPGLKPHRDYYFAVVAESAMGESSPASDVVKVRTGRVSLARGKSYTKSLEPYGGYQDAGGESTDGVYAGGYRDGRSYGYRLGKVGASVEVEIVVDLGSVQTVARATVRRCGAAGYGADRLDAATSVDGKTWRAQGASTEPRAGHLVVDFAPTAARYVKFRPRKTRHGQADDWLFVGELEVF